MKVWCFYLKPWKVKSELLKEFNGMFDERFIELEGVKCPLYAFTDNKKIKKNFIQTRNEDILFHIKYDLDEDEFRKFKGRFNELEILEYPYSINDENGEFTDVFIPTTFFESSCYEDYYEYGDDILLNIQYEYQVAIGKIIKSLKKKYQKMINIDDIVTINDNINSINIGDPVFVNVNGVNYLIRTFGELFKIEVN